MQVRKVGPEEGCTDTDGSFEMEGSNDGCADSEGMFETEGACDGVSDGLSEGIWYIIIPA